MIEETASIEGRLFFKAGVFLVEVILERDINAK